MKKYTNTTTMEVPFSCSSDRIERMREKSREVIQIRAYFSGYRPVGREYAKSFIKKMMDGMRCSEEKKIELIEKNHLKGITYRELMQEV